MSPQAERIEIPDGYELHRRHVCAPRTDERPTVRDQDGHVLAVVESWRPTDNDMVN